MTAATTFLLLLVLVCPLMMVLMRGHGHGGGHDREPEPRAASIEDLRRRRDEFERLIAEREQDSKRELTPTG